MEVCRRQLYHFVMLRLTILAVLVTGAAEIAFAGDALPAYVLRLPPSVRAVFIADTGASTFYRYRNAADGITAVDTHYMSIGQNGVGKQRHWDRRTPLGVYFVSDELDTEMLHP